MNVYEAISVRKACRDFEFEEISDQKLKSILHYANGLTPYDPRIRVAFRIEKTIDKKPPVKGMFLRKAPYYLVLSSERKENDFINAGYLLEQVSLYMTTLGIGSCFLGGAKPTEKLGKELAYNYVIALAFGKASGSCLREKNKIKRKKLEEVCIVRPGLSEEMRTVLNAARLAPSSFNSQPWRFAVSEGKIHVFCRNNRLLSSTKKVNQIDVGIAISHLCIAAEELWLNSYIKRLDNLEHKDAKKYRYVSTVFLKRVEVFD